MKWRSLPTSLKQLDREILMTNSYPYLLTWLLAYTAKKLVPFLYRVQH